MSILIRGKKRGEWQGPYSARYGIPKWKLVLLDLTIPEFLGQPWHYESMANVIDRMGGGLSGYWLKVKFNDHRDSQCLYPNWWKSRVAHVEVSKKLFHAKPFWVPIFYQFSRHQNLETSVRVKIAC